MGDDPTPDETNPRVFKTAWFAKAASKADIRDAVLCKDMREIMAGKCDGLGGGVWKKRTGNRGSHRTIALHVSGRNWIYVYLYAKSDRANIGDQELMYYRDLADDFAKAADRLMDHAVNDEKLTEICHEKRKAKIPK
jgi:hypothetical protein